MLLKRKYLFGTTILAGVMAVTAPAFAQSSQLPGVTVQGQSDQDATEIGEVVVTGSRIRRDPTNAPTPLIQVSREALLTTGQATVIDYLATIPALSNSLVPSDTTGSNLNDGGLSFANLRSLGTGRTLVLVDGRRHVGASEGSLSVDVDSIPRLLIESIEIVTGGASSVYGADAVSGVLNFVMRKDFEGLEVDANYGMINQDGQANKRVSVLAGANLFDDRLNLYAFGEYEDIDEVQSLDIDWLKDARILVGVDADPTTATNDGDIDARVFRGLTTLSRPRWGVLTLANAQQPSALNDPDVPLTSCVTTAVLINRSGNCYSLDPTKTFVFEGSTARLANFGQRIGNTGANRVFNIGGDGENPAAFGQESRVGQSTSSRFQVGANFALLDNVMLRGEYKFISEDTFDVSQPTFYDFFLDDSQYLANQTSSVYATNAFGLRFSDNAYLPANVRAAIAGNTVTNFTTNATTPGTPVAPSVARAWARHAIFGPQRTQDNHREVERFVIALNGDLDQIAFVKNIAWDIGYTFGEARNRNIERGTDNQRFNLAADAIVDLAGVVNGRPGEVVCRSRLIQAQGGAPTDNFFGGLLSATPEGRAALAACTPLNVFGKGNQSQAALNYVDASITVSHVNQQEQGIASVSGQLWDFFGAGAIGVAVGAEYRRESTEGIGRSAGTGNRSLFLNTGADFALAEYESEEAFAELSLPLFRDSWLGEYAELSGSYRYFDYTTAGTGDVYGVNLVYRPIQDITFKSSFNTSFRAPNLSENFRPFSQTFANGFVDPCATLQIAAQTAQIRTNRIANCTALAASLGFTGPTGFDFAGATVTNADDFNPNYTSGIAGVTGGNPTLVPETSESFTFSTVLQPRFIPNFSLVLDYYEIQITDVIASVGAQQLHNNCVSGPTLNANACATLVRLNPTIPFGFGNVPTSPTGAFIQGSVNYASLQTRGLDFTATYSLDLEEVLGRSWGSLNYRIGGLWLIEQKQFLNAANPADFAELASGVFFPRVRFTSSLTYVPNDTWSVNWSVDWQTAQNSVFRRDLVALGNLDARPTSTYNTGDFARHDFTIRYNASDDLSVRFGVVNAFDAEPAEYLGTATTSNFDPFGTRFFIGLNYRPY